MRSASPRVQCDRNTLADLGLAESDGSDSVLQLFESRCWSIGGRRALKALLAAPPRALEEIRARQALMRRLAGWSDHDWASFGRITADVERYLDATLDVLPRHIADLWIARWRDAGAVYRLLYGIGATRDLLVLTRELAERAFGRLGAGATGIEELRPVGEALAHPGARALLKSDHAPLGIRLGRFDDTLRRASPPFLRALLDALYHLDAMQALARSTSGDGFAVPEFVDGDRPHFEAIGLRHPLVTDAVGNDLTLDDAGRVVFLTGPNMAGKTTFLRACGVAVCLAHAGAGIPARSGRLTAMDRVFSSIVVRDRIGRGESYYLAEVRRVGFLVDRLLAGERVVALLDEPFKGTNVHDALDATQLVVEGLARAPQLMCMISSHLAELAERIPGGNGVRFQHFTAAQSDGRWMFDYRLREGVSSQRLGMELLRRERIPELLDAIPARAGS